MMNINYRLKQKFTNIADAIRAGLSSTELMTVDEMPPNIEDITTQDNAIIDTLLNGTATTYENNRITFLRASGLRGYENLQTAIFGNLTDAGNAAFQGCSNLTDLIIPKFETFRVSVLQACTSLQRVNAPKATTVQSYAFSGATNLEILNFYDPNRTSIPRVTSSAGVLLNTKIAAGTGYIIINDELVEDMKVAFFWSDYADQIIGNTEAAELGIL